MADISDLISYYVNLLIIQYHDQPKAQATIALFADEFLASGIIFDVQDGYSVDTAVGLQLDVIGKYVGIDRQYQPQDLDGYFSTIIYSQAASPPTQLGMTDYATYPLPTGKTLTYNDLIGGNALLSDDSFRVLIRLAIITNNSNFSHQSIDANMFATFGSTVIPSSAGNMEMWYFVPLSLSPVLLAALQKGLLPKPMGVEIRGLIETDESMFGFATYDAYSPLITGFSTYADYATKAGNTLNYDVIIH